jgi:hypothetical protein
MLKSENERPLCLTEEEALGLLDVILTNPAELTPEQRAAALKLSEFCRELIREAAVNSVLPATAHATPRTFAS